MIALEMDPPPLLRNPPTSTADVHRCGQVSQRPSDLPLVSGCLMRILPPISDDFNWFPRDEVNVGNNGLPRSWRNVEMDV